MYGCILYMCTYVYQFGLFQANLPMVICSNDGVGVVLVKPNIESASPITNTFTVSMATGLVTIRGVVT